MSGQRCDNRRPNLIAFSDSQSKIRSTKCIKNPYNSLWRKTHKCRGVKVKGMGMERRESFVRYSTIKFSPNCSHKSPQSVEPLLPDNSNFQSDFCHLSSDSSERTDRNAIRSSKILRQTRMEMRQLKKKIRIDPKFQSRSR